MTNEMDMPTTPLTVTLSNPITVEKNGLVVLDAYAKDYNRNIATTYKMVDGYDGPAIIVEEGGGRAELDPWDAFVLDSLIWKEDWIM